MVPHMVPAVNQLCSITAPALLGMRSHDVRTVDTISFREMLLASPEGHRAISGFSLFDAMSNHTFLISFIANFIPPAALSVL
jgi:hypothetical protein